MMGRSSPTVVQAPAAQPDPTPTPTPTPAPAAPDPVRVPGATDPDVVAARRSKVQAEFADRRGRDSTRLAQRATGDVSYSRTTLG